MLVNVEWSAIPGLVRAHAVMAAGIVCLGVFVSARSSESDLVEIGGDVTYNIASAIAAAVIVGTIFTSLGGFPIWNLRDEEDWEAAAFRDFTFNVPLGADRAGITWDLVETDAVIETWGNSEISVTGTLKVYSDVSEEDARSHLDALKIDLVRSDGGGSDYVLEMSGDGSLISGLRRKVKVELAVKVPSDLAIDLDLKAASGELLVDGCLIGESELEVISGSITLRDTTGDSLSASVANGRVNGSLGFGTADVSVVNGGLNLSILPGGGDYELRNTNGPVEAMVPAADDLALWLKGETVNGDVVFERDGLNYSREKANSKEARTPGYDSADVHVKIDAATVNGEVLIR